MATFRQKTNPAQGNHDNGTPCHFRLDKGRGNFPYILKQIRWAPDSKFRRLAVGPTARVFARARRFAYQAIWSEVAGALAADQAASAAILLGFCGTSP